jgi:hypothetical protein
MTHPILDRRRAAILRNGESATLRRQTAVTPSVTYTAVTLTAAVHDFKPGDLQAGHRQGDRQADILAEEITAAAWPGPPAPGDTLVTSEGILAVVAAPPVRIGAEIGGWRLWVRGP